MKLISDAPALIANLRAPSEAIFEMAVDLAISHMTENVFPHPIETILGMITAERALKKVFPGFDLDRLTDVKRPPVLDELRCIDKAKPDLLSKVLVPFQTPYAERPGVDEDNWWMFLRQLCLEAGENFIAYIGNACPIPINDLNQIMKLPEFKPLPKEEVKDDPVVNTNTKDSLPDILANLEFSGELR